MTMKSDFSNVLTSGRLIARFGRTLMLAGMAAGLALAAPLPAQASNSQDHPDDIQQITAPENPLSLIISLEDQTIDVYRGMELVDSSRISSGMRGFESPSGIFSILQKNRYHRSNIYSNAPMPYMQRLTWSGIALHGGNVPNRPASHGCIRLPMPFAEMLFGLTERSAHVIITYDKARPEIVRHENLFQPRPDVVTSDSTGLGLRPALRYASSEVRLEAENPSWMFGDFEAGLPGEVARTPYSDEPLRILVTRRTGRERVMDVQTLLNDLGYDSGDVDGYIGSMTANAVKGFQGYNDLQATGIITDDLITALYRAAGRGLPPTGHIYVRQGFEDLFDAPMRIIRPEDALGTHIYTAMQFQPLDDKVDWVGITAERSPITGLTEALDRIEIPPHIRRQISNMLTPGSSLTISDNGISIETLEAGTDFIVLTPPPAI
jgi:L,D-transpeptidase-like protein/putative peptidoglycan binding protein